MSSLNLKTWSWSLTIFFQFIGSPTKASCSHFLKNKSVDLSQVDWPSLSKSSRDKVASTPRSQQTRNIFEKAEILLERMFRKSINQLNFNFECNNIECIFWTIIFILGWLCKPFHWGRCFGCRSCPGKFNFKSDQ